MTNKPSTRRITMLFRSATPDEIEAGANWYLDQFRVAGALAKTYVVPVQKVAGIIAALSPQNSWGHNVNLTARFLESEGTMTTGYLGGQLAKARAIYHDVDFVKYLDERILTILGGVKTINFFLSIASAGEEGVCIDRHAYSLAVGERFDKNNPMPTLSGARYTDTAQAYVRAARILSAEFGSTFTPAQVQSVTWTLWRRKFWADGAFDKHEEV